jgi:hypothetical protein
MKYLFVALSLALLVGLGQTSITNTTDFWNNQTG